MIGRIPGVADKPEPDWWRPPLVGHPAAMDSMSVIAAPLLGGFSITLIGVVAQAPGNFALPGLVMLILSVAVVFFVASVQCGFWARQYLTSPADLRAWEFAEGDDAKLQQVKLCRAYEAWRQRTSRSYELAILTLTLGLGTALVPVNADSGFDAVARWVAVAVLAVAFLGEYLWIRGPGYLNKLPGLRRVPGLRRLNLNWFYPARERSEDHESPAPTATAPRAAEAAPAAEAAAETGRAAEPAPSGPAA